MRGLGCAPGTWRVSSHSEGSSQVTCVEVVWRARNRISVRDSTRRAETALVFPPWEWAALVRLAHSG
ncbi:DUF397 domain-containing protein [Nocardiopsis sp. NPDC050513]|uniref:DUF397 domain-containing protein n=1 Tax=Nocardiopsis sp. NPDC050513 TaxID=3364338 RepID=UPI00379BE993